MIWILLLIIALVAALLLVTPLLNTTEKTAVKPAIVTSFMGIFIAASLGLYALLGTPVPPQPTSLPLNTSQNTTETSPQIGQADIQRMVDGLAARLVQTPEDAEGWTRLIRSRIVMQDITNLIQDHTRMTTYYADRPEIIVKINAQSGFNDFAADISDVINSSETP